MTGTAPPPRGPAVDPGAPPEGRGLVVRAHGEGFYARIHPRPPIPWTRIAVTGAGLSVIGLSFGYALAFGRATGPADPVLAAEIFASVVLFGALLLGFSHGTGYFPVEITADDAVIAWGGDRYPIGAIGDCAADAGTLRLTDPDGRVLAVVDGADPAAAAWVARAVRASLPPLPSPAPATGAAPTPPAR